MEGEIQFKTVGSRASAGPPVKPEDDRECAPEDDRMGQAQRLLNQRFPRKR
ncbi:MAG: hypothetical protein LBQ58_01850 [Synergistaceae bacterium]|nr:hypothetical protein [Synergistaceae bacterium]